MKLISMTDFVLELWEDNLMSQIGLLAINYANFLKQPLKLEMFVPCDEDGNVLQKPEEHFPTGNNNLEKQIFIKQKKYKQAKEKVLFEGFEVIGVDENHTELELKNNDFWIDFFKHSSIITTDSYQIDYPVKLCEDLLGYNLILTESALKQLGL
jgi:hypothetical protein